jgi:UTP-glucose-1-phosphate uridylyltransferase
MKPTLLVLAAGMGSRYGGLKQVDPVGPNGETIIDYCIHDALRGGFGKVVFVIRHDIEATFREVVGARFEKRLPVEYAYQELDKLPTGYTVPAGRTKPWGTAHAILMAEDVIREPFAMINADDFYGADSFRVLGQFLSASPNNSRDYAMVGFVLRNTLSEYGTVSRAVGQANGSMLHSLVEMLKIEKTPTGARNLDGGQILTGNEYCSMNMWGFTPTLFPFLREELTKFLKERATELKSECLIPTVVNTLVTGQRATVKILPTQSSWFGVTYQEDRPKVQASVRALIERGEYPAKLWV